MAQRKTNRRQFLLGESAVEALSTVGESWLPPPEPSQSGNASRSFLFQIERAAMACRFEVLLNAGQYAQGPATALRALDLIDELESQLTVYRTQSEVQDINAVASQHPVSVESRLFVVLRRAWQLWKHSGGAFDMTTGPLSRLWGFYRRQGRLPADADIEEALSRIGTQFVELDEAHQTAFFRQADIEINLNSIGKGYALDRCAELFEEYEIDDYLIHGGNSSILARGHRETASSDGWTVALRHPLRPELSLGRILLRNRSLATSGTAHQFFYHRGRRYSHLLDPRTGRPAEGVLSATVLSGEAALADALATTCFILGVDDSEALLDHYPNVGMIFVLPGRKAGCVEIVTLNLSEEDWEAVVSC